MLYELLVEIYSDFIPTNEIVEYSDLDDDFFKVKLIDKQIIPTSVYKHLLPNSIKIKCDDCGQEWKLENVSHERKLTDDEILVKFHNKRDMEMDTCCKWFTLVWNVIL